MHANNHDAAFRRPDAPVVARHPLDGGREPVRGRARRWLRRRRWRWYCIRQQHCQRHHARDRLHESHRQQHGASHRLGNCEPRQERRAQLWRGVPVGPQFSALDSAAQFDSAQAALRALIDRRRAQVPAMLR